MLRALLFLTFLFLLKSTRAQSPTPSPLPRNRTKCVNRFYTDRSHFEPCRSVPCVVFLTEIPFIILDKNITSEDDVKLFKCKDRKKVYPGLRGISWDVMDLLPLDEALCVFGGPKCSYEGMMEFVDREQDHQFLVGGLMFQLPHRLTETRTPSSSLIEDKVVIVGKRDSKSPIAQAYTTILRPFQFWTWIMLLCIFLMFGVVRIIIAAIFVEKRTLRNIARHCIGEYNSKQVKLRYAENPENVRILNKGAVYGLKLASSAFFVIVLLFYEISVVNFVFLKRTHAIQKELSNLSEREMRQYIIIKGGATEIIWASYVDPERKYENRTPPWHFCNGQKDCYNKILDENHPAKYSMSYETVVRYELKQRKACDLLTVFETVKPLYAFAAGWYYGGVPKRTQLKIDRGILELRLQDKIRQLVNRVSDAGISLNCAAFSTDIPPGILGWLLLSVIGICMLPVAASSIAVLKISCREDPGLDGRDDLRWADD